MQQGGHILPGPGVPEAHSLIIAPGHQKLAAARNRQRPHIAAVAIVVEQLAALQIIGADPAMATCGENVLAPRQEAIGVVGITVLLAALCPPKLAGALADVHCVPIAERSAALMFQTPPAKAHRQIAGIGNGRIQRLRLTKRPVLHRQPQAERERAGIVRVLELSFVSPGNAVAVVGHAHTVHRPALAFQYSDDLGLVDGPHMDFVVLAASCGRELSIRRYGNGQHDVVVAAIGDL